MIRLLLVLLCVAVLGTVIWGMRVGWRHRAARQSGLGPLPEPAAELGSPIIVAEPGLYVGTTSARSWQASLPGSSKEWGWTSCTWSLRVAQPIGVNIAAQVRSIEPPIIWLAVSSPSRSKSTFEYL